MAHCRLEIEGKSTRDTKVLLDGHDISNTTRAVSVDLRVGEPITATLEVFVKELKLGEDVDAKVLLAEGEERTSFVSRFRELR